ncbi:MAG TPA: tRNA lysidine(34) synthetase TilS, partial [Candidatus Krumholzibacterium sp.]|nr:tRNA lysidine(34) synthetase TilS [Candidatus Krumholzibacterium sp.]
SSGKRVRLPHGISVYLRQKDLRFAMTEAERPVLRTGVTIPREGTFTLAPWFGTVTVETLSGREGRSLLKKGGGSGDAPAPGLDAVMAFAGFPLRVRQREAGDRLIPFGMKGSRKLSDILIDRKIDLDTRDRLPVFEDPAGIIWVPGVVASERTRVTPATGRVIRVRIALPPEARGGGKKRM